MDSVSQWIDQLKGSRQEQAAEHLWNRYLQDLLRVARGKLRAVPKSVADEHDVAIQAFMGLLNGVREDRFWKLSDRHDLWQVLIMLTERRAIDQRRKFSGKRPQAVPLPHDLPSPDPTPELAGQLAEEFVQRLESLPDDIEREIATRRLQGYTNTEISAALEIPLRTVERKLNLIRRTWHEDPLEEE